MKTIAIISFALLLTSVSTEIRAQANSKPSAAPVSGSSAPDPNSDEKAAQIQNTPYIIDDNGEKVYFLADPSTKDLPVQQPSDRSSIYPAKGNAKNDPE